MTIRCELLQHDLALLEAVQAHLAQLESRLAELVAPDPVSSLDQIKGLSVVQVASLAAAIGDPANYTEPAKSSAAPASSVAATIPAIASAKARAITSSRPAMSISAAR